LLDLLALFREGGYQCSDRQAQLKLEDLIWWSPADI